MRNARLLVLPSLALILAACVPVPPEMMPKSAAPASAPGPSSIPDVEPSGITQSSLHFTVRGYLERDMQAVSGLAEDLYNKIGNDTGLYSYMAGQTYTLVVYKDHSEYETKTKQPSWSRALQVGHTLYTYPGPDLAPALAHELMHLIFNAYMGDRAGGLLWLREGLAMVEEVAAMSDYERVVFRTTQNNKLRTDRQTFSQMTFFAAPDEEKRRKETWFLQVESVVSHLMQQGSSLAFAAFLNQLRNGSDLNQALSNAYSAKFRNLADFEASWQAQH